MMEVPQLWSVLFFMMLITLGIDVTFADVETIATSIIDHFKFRSGQKSAVVAGICAAGFLLGLSMVTQGGLYMFTLIDSTAFSWNLLLFALLEVLLAAWIYGVDPFFKNLEEMNIRLWGPVKWYWIVCWKFVTPAILGILGRNSTEFQYKPCTRNPVLEGLFITCCSRSIARLSDLFVVL